MAKLERLEKNVVDTAAAALAAQDDAEAWDAYANALDELDEYLKEQDDD